MNWFPYNYRKHQEEISLLTMEALKSGKNLIFSAPTGIGKTVAVESPLLKYASENNMKVLYFTNRSSNQILPLKEFKKIKQKFPHRLNAGRITCKKDLCPRKGIDTKDLQAFYRICSEKKEECKHYSKLYKKLMEGDKTIFNKLFEDNPNAFMSLLDLEEDLCPYYLIKKFLGRYADLIILDYQYILNPFIKSSFFKTCGIKLNECILVFDECHNLPEQARNAASISISTYNFVAAINEINDYEEKFVEKFIEKADEQGLREDLESVKDVMESLDRRVNAMISKKGEMPFTLSGLTKKISSIKHIIPILDDIAKIVESDEKRSRCRTVHSFLSMLITVENDEKFIRFIKTDKYSSLNIRCLDPSYIFKPIIDESYSTICFSGTLNIKSFKDMLGFPENTLTEEFPSPFSQEQRRYIVFPSVYADFTMKNRRKNIEQKADALVGIINTMQGNVLVIFPSADVFKVYVPLMENSLNKRVFKRPFAKDFGIEHDYKRQRTQTLNQFKASNDSVLFTIAYGSYSEGVDYKDALQNAIIVGFPYPSVDYERLCLSKYFDEKFGVKGYGRFLSFVLPGIQKTVQSAGRVIRSEKNKGIILFFGKQFGKGSWLYGKYFDLLTNEIKKECIIAKSIEDVKKIIQDFDVFN